MGKEWSAAIRILITEQLSPYAAESLSFFHLLLRIHNFMPVDKRKSIAERQLPKHMAYCEVSIRGKVNLQSTIASFFKTILKIETKNSGTLVTSVMLDICFEKIYEENLPRFTMSLLRKMTY